MSTDTDTKKLARGEERFIVKKNDKSYRVYDRLGGSYPYRTIELGTVLQDVPELEAQAEADRLNEKFVGVLPAPRGKTIQAKRELGDLPPSRVTGRKSAPQKKQKDTAPEAAVDLFKEAEYIEDAAEQLPDYGDLSEQTDGYVDWKMA